MEEESVKEEFKLENVSQQFGNCFEGQNVRMDKFVDAYRELIRWGDDINESIVYNGISTTTGNDYAHFCNRVINTWNALPDSIVSATSVSVFKRKIAPLSF